MRTIKEITDNPNFIPGIYNYCDRWCERCPFTSKCANYAIGQERFGNKKINDLENAEFWKALSDLLRETKEMVLQDAAERGIDLSNLDAEVERPSLEEANKHLLIRLCMQYEDESRKWLEDPVYVNQETYEYFDAKKVELSDATEVIQWYQFQIDVKFRRALDTLYDLNENDDDLMATDMNGSAKVALIGIDRSLAAWKVLLKMMPDRQESIFNIIALLKKIQSIGEKQFPAARSFIRPGWDE
ncbi:MAG TPA: hypothetical protein PLD62_04275 [Candidatus Cloacimonadota bacterium]|nr:hypothetical protein [Candidatus Cloacimonadota bacterium]